MDQVVGHRVVPRLHPRQGARPARRAPLDFYRAFIDPTHAAREAIDLQFVQGAFRPLARGDPPAAQGGLRGDPRDAFEGRRPLPLLHGVDAVDLFRAAPRASRAPPPTTTTTLTTRRRVRASQNSRRRCRTRRRWATSSAGGASSSRPH